LGRASCMNQFKYVVPPEGPTTAKIAVVCEKPGKDEANYGQLRHPNGKRYNNLQPRLLVGETGKRVRRHLREAGLSAGSDRDGDFSTEVWLTNAVQSFDEIGNPSNSDIAREQPRLFKELLSLPNLSCIIGMGAVALKSLTNFQLSEITNWRGSIIPTCFGTKLIPTFHPSFYVRGEWRYQPVVQFDVNRAVKESTCPQIIRKPRTWFIRPSGLPEVMEWFSHLLNYPTSKSPYVSFDIETCRGRNGSWYISCIAFAVDPTEAFCIPLMHRDRQPYWPEISAESLIWLKITELLSLPNRIYVTQNGAGFDCPVLRHHGIRTPYMSKGFDTYSAHSLLAPDLPHKLAFIVSIYTNEPFYKDEASQSGRGRGGYGDVPEDQFWIYNCKDAAFTLESAIEMIRDMKEL
jgi:uracil-DNA glycosylase